MADTCGCEANYRCLLGYFRFQLMSQSIHIHIYEYTNLTDLWTLHEVVCVSVCVFTERKSFALIRILMIWCDVVVHGSSLSWLFAPGASHPNPSLSPQD